MERNAISKRFKHEIVDEGFCLSIFEILTDLCIILGDISHDDHLYLETTVKREYLQLYIADIPDFYEDKLMTTSIRYTGNDLPG